jgi:8-oxo-dGTP diphosphatase
MTAGVHRFLLKVFRRLPERGRVGVVHLVAPLHTVGALALVTREDGARLLVRQTYKDGWGMPGGLLRRGEHPSEAVVREVREELGIVIELLGEPAVVVDPGPRRVDIVFRACVVRGEAAPESDEIAEVRWFPADALPALQPEAVSALASMERLGRERPSH